MTIADYSVLHDGPFELSTNHVKRMTFDLPGDYVKGTFRAKPLLMYRVMPQRSANWIAIINDPPGDDTIPQEKIHEHVIQNNSGALRTLHEAISGDVFLPGTNIIDIRVLSGRATFMDVVLFYQRNTGEGD